MPARRVSARKTSDTVHEAQVEDDCFTVVDDLPQESGEQGSAGIFDTELASGLKTAATSASISASWRRTSKASNPRTISLLRPLRSAASWVVGSSSACRT